MLTIDYSEHIDRYITGQMQPDEVLWFEKELEGNSSLQQELRFHQNMKGAILEEDVLMFRQVLEAAHADFEQQREPEPKAIFTGRIRRFTKIAAGIALIAATSIFIWYMTGKGYSTRELYDMYFKPYKVTMNVRSSQDAQNTLLRNALIQYEKGDYQDAITGFREILQNQQMNLAVQLYAGISFMETEKYAEANNSFQRIMDHKNNLYVEQAEWYAGLCYLVTDQKDKAKKQFMRIAHREGFYKNQANEILSRLD